MSKPDGLIAIITLRPLVLMLIVASLICLPALGQEDVPDTSSEAYKQLIASGAESQGPPAHDDGDATDADAATQPQPVQEQPATDGSADDTTGNNPQQPATYAELPDDVPPLRWDDPVPAVWMTWQRDPTTTATIHWLAQPESPTGLHYEHGSTDNPTQGHAASLRRPMPGTKLVVHTAELTGLTPDTQYRVTIPGRDEPVLVRTLSADPNKTIRFVATADVYKDHTLLEKMLTYAAATDPHFVLISGDIAYANARTDLAWRWLAMFQAWQRIMTRSDGSMIPWVVTLGNHEVLDGYQQPKTQATFFYNLFAYPGPVGYGVLDVGQTLSILLLDSGHTNPIGGAQTQWLASTLANRAKTTHIVAAYHVPAYPSKRSLDSWPNTDVRRYWVPRFEEMGVDLTFEGHDHAYKRTQPIRKNQVDPTGVIYFGDGGMAAEVRKPAQPGDGGLFANRRWYLARTAQAHHFMLVTIDGKERSVVAINDQGLVFDSYRATDGQPAAVELTYSAGVFQRVELQIIIALFALAGAAIIWFRVTKQRWPGQRQ